MSDLNDGSVDYTFLVTPFIYWPMIESGVGIIGACLPLMRPLVSGATSRGFMRNLRSFNGTTSDRSDTFWEHDDNTALREEWNNSITTTKFGSASQLSAKMEGSISTMKWETESLPPVDPNYRYPGYDPTRAPAAIPMRKITKLGVLDDDDDILNDYPLPAKSLRRQPDMI
ncbi:MAG: hypothetical protein Q9195_006767 [Heterodermia aff. obscurata]